MVNEKRRWLMPIIMCGFILLLSIVHVYRFFTLRFNYTTLIMSTEMGSTTNLEETYAYAPYVNRVKFDQPINDPYMWEHRRGYSPFISEALPAFALGFLAKIIEIPFLLVLIKVFGPILLVLLLRWIGILGGFDRLISTVSALAAVFTPMLFSLAPYSISLSYVTGATELEFQRLFHPLLPMIMLSLYIIYVEKALSSANGHNRLAILFAGILLGSLFYTYFFVWTLAWMGIALATMTYFGKTGRSNLKYFIAIMTIGAIIGIPYFVNGWQFSNSDLGHDFWEKSLLPIKELHAWKMIRYLFLLALVIISDRGWIKRSVRRMILGLMISAMILPDLSQVVFGGNIESDHWIVRFLYPLSTFVAILSVGSWISKKSVIIRSFALWGLIGLVALRLAVVANHQVKQPVNLFQLGDKRRELLTFMERNLESDSVVGSLSFTEEIYLAAYTPFYPFIPRWERTVALKGEPMERLIFLAQQLKVSESYFDDVMPVPLVPINYQYLPRFDQKALAVVFGIEYLFDEPPYYRHQVLLEQVKDKYHQPAPDSRKLDYVLITPTDRQFAGWDFGKNCQPMFDNSTYQIYRFDSCWKL